LSANSAFTTVALILLRAQITAIIMNRTVSCDTVTNTNFAPPSVTHTHTHTPQKWRRLKAYAVDCVKRTGGIKRRVIVSAYKKVNTHEPFRRERIRTGIFTFFLKRIFTRVVVGRNATFVFRPVPLSHYSSSSGTWGGLASDENHKSRLAYNWSFRRCTYAENTRIVSGEQQ